MSSKVSNRDRLKALVGMTNDQAFEEIVRIAEDCNVRANDIGLFFFEVGGLFGDAEDERGAPADRLIGVMWHKRPGGVSKLEHAKSVLEVVFRYADCFGSYPSSVVEEVEELGSMLREFSAADCARLALFILTKPYEYKGGEAEARKSLEHDARGMAESIIRESVALSYPKVEALFELLSEAPRGILGIEYKRYVTCVEIIRDLVT